MVEEVVVPIGIWTIWEKVSNEENGIFLTVQYFDPYCCMSSPLFQLEIIDDVANEESISFQLNEV